ncbi:DUF3299 domain-containing protein [Lampropedia puyangensis]|uniref:DUF3299 domain-containing protein n=1 Tax=Lampropedia puyangensis TaxID=1330072 RepID=A0A4S8FC21_9BURK|nr:DUF3299 domain-containing protein [Lampropedia puyangensis]THU05188.1 DUF3299 domain-containing protein [Lampropedia puyangensis]
MTLKNLSSIRLGSTFKRHTIHFIMALSLGCGVCLLAQTPAVASSSEKIQTVSWDDLVPANWDPSNEFLDLMEQGAADWEDSDPRAAQLYERMRKIWDSAPTVNTYNGKKIRLPGYVVALEEGKQGLTELLLVPNFGACIHTPPPPANQIIHIKLDKPVKGFVSLDAVWVTGELEVNRTDSDMGVSGYSLKNASLQAYKGEK